MSRHTAVDSESFQGAWGYCAVVGTKELLWSGHRIPDLEAVVGLADYVAGLHDGLSLESALSRKVFTDGAVSWLANELVEATYRQARDSESAPAREDVDFLAAALAQVTGERFFIVMLERNRAREALAAGVEAVAVDSPEDARDYILHHPRILALEAEGMRRLHEIQPAGALTEGMATFTCERLHGPMN